MYYYRNLYNNINKNNTRLYKYRISIYKRNLSIQIISKKKQILKNRIFKLKKFKRNKELPYGKYLPRMCELLLCSFSSTPCPMI